MIAIDTNILIRILTNDDPDQCRKANAIVEKYPDAESVFISDVVMAEVEWVLDYTYGLSRDHICSALSRILHIDQFRFTDKELLFRALTKYRTSKGDFSDCIIGEQGKAIHARTYSFDKSLKHDPNFMVI